MCGSLCGEIGINISGGGVEQSGLGREYRVRYRIRLSQGRPWQGQVTMRGTGAVRPLALPALVTLAWVLARAALEGAVRNADDLIGLTDQPRRTRAA